MIPARSEKTRLFVKSRSSMILSFLLSAPLTLATGLLSAQALAAGGPSPAEFLAPEVTREILRAQGFDASGVQLVRTSTGTGALPTVSPTPKPEDQDEEVVEYDEDNCPMLTPPRQLRLIKSLPAQDPCQNRGTSLVALTDIQVLFLCENGRSVANYDLSLGSKGLDKRVQGDRKTPLGSYPLTPARRSAQYGLFMHVGYPTAQQRSQGYTGSDIGIHGPDRWFRCAGFLNVAFNWTAGCLAVSSDLYMQEVAEFVRTRHQARRPLMLHILPPASTPPPPLSRQPDPTSTPRPRATTL